MISPETIKDIATGERTDAFPNVVREYVQHLFLSELYRLPEARNLLFKGGTALRILYGSPRFSEDLDFSYAPSLKAARPEKEIERSFIGALSVMEAGGIGIELGRKSAPTSGGYFGVASARVEGFDPINIEINVSLRRARGAKAEVDNVTGPFVATYVAYHLPQDELVEEKVFGALMDRKKPRDYYDLYFMLRRNMLSSDQKRRLGAVAGKVLEEAAGTNFKGELGAFLPADQQPIVKDFAGALEREMRSRLAMV